MPWERLQEGPDESFTDDLDADVLLSEGRVSRASSWLPSSCCPTQLLHNFTSSRHRYWFIFFLLTLLLVSLLPIILVMQNQRHGGGLEVGQHPVINPPGSTRPPFLDPLEFDNNSSETSLRSFSPPEFSPLLDFFYDYFSLLQSPADADDSSGNGTKTAAGSNSTLEVTIYYESLDIPSRIFLAHAFFPTYFNSSQGRFSAKLIPFGHAHFVTGKGSEREKLTCENERDECEGNLVQACAIRHTKWNQTTSVARLMRYIQCLMADTGRRGPILDTAQDAAGINCVDQVVGVAWDPIYNCTRSDEGLQILHKFKEMTDAVLQSGSGLKYSLPVVQLKGYGVLSEAEKNDFPRFIQTRLDLLPERTRA